MAKFTPGRIFIIHLSIIVMLGLAFSCVVVADLIGHQRLKGISALFRLQREDNIPSIFSALALLVAGIAANAVRTALPQENRERQGWTIFTWAFLFMSIDEAVHIHELIALPRRLRHVSEYLYYFGVFPYVLFSAWLGVYLFPFWLRQSRTVRNGIAFGGVMFVAAAVGMELLENKLAAEHMSPYALRMAVNYAAEELGEMVAVALLLKAFLTRLAELGGGYLLPVAIAADPLKETRSDRARTAPAFAVIPETDLSQP